MALSKEEIGNIRNETQKTEHNTHKPINEPKKNKKVLFFSVGLIAVLLIGAGIGYSFVSSNKSGYLDGFAQCLSDKGAVMYGASFCKFSAAQKGMFGKSFKFIDYRDFTENNEVKITPTWFIDGKKYENVQSLDKLSVITGCVIGS
ncbi:MAG: hypothetical protein QF436_01915 [Candidatus Woesearchaeota archaeon]|jgi:hypothetical protein|nr:hypothetical protein [Candidatus Woesearchaeota archaeon]MDP7622847.1 hypothetical protein [Candidatus Woesearchaeota archaeon]HJN56893.1 hypothetical protein [Candidatus Woesearchaeota archaeon]|tara:strand:- start:37408 stop:37845 length:438 start_codon:yes stop_codon:yes gene_type:complete